MKDRRQYTTIITKTNRVPQTKNEEKVRSAYVRIKIHIYRSYEHAKRVAAETETEETA